MTNKPRIYLSSPHMSGREQDYIREAFDTNWVAPLGPNVDGFEKELAAYVGINAAAAVSSGSAALHLAMRLLNVTRGDTVFCSTLTFIPSATAIVFVGAEPVFIDSEPDSWNMCPRALERALKEAKKVGKLPKAIVVVDLYGQSAKMDEIVQICNHYKIPVVEDAAESLGAEYKGKKSGTFGKLGIYSFNGNKIITTSGGGMLVSADQEMIEKARFLATQARDSAPHYEHSQIGYNYRMSNVLAGIGRAQLQVLDERVAARRAIFNRYTEALSGIEGIEFMPELAGSHHNRWLTTLSINPNQLTVKPIDVVRSLEVENIEARPVWKPLHLQPVFRGSTYYAFDAGRSVAEEVFNTGVCLPSGSNMSKAEQDRVINHLLKLFLK